jgi:putative DNA primase/helicase
VDAEHPDKPLPPGKVVDLRSGKPLEGAAGHSDDVPPLPEGGDDDMSSKGKGGKRKPIDYGKFLSMLERFVLVYPTDTAWDSEKRKLVKIANMAHMFGTDYVRMWKAHPDRKHVDQEQLVFDPTGACGADAINLWDGLEVEPVECDSKDCQPMIDLLTHLCSRCDSSVSTVDEIREWVLCWLAYPLQHRGAKLATALVFHGPQGVGKNLFFDVIRKMYGKYGVMVGQTEIEEKYNGWLSAKQFVIGNEVVSRQELYHMKNRLKWVIDSETIPIRMMNMDTRFEQNWANLVFLSNENKPLVLEDGDRRHLVVYTPTPEDKGVYDRVRKFLEDDGAGKFLHYLLTQPLGDFGPHTKPPMTEAKRELIELSMSPDERFMAEWIEGFLTLPLQVCSNEQLYQAFRRWCERSGERYVPAQHAFTTQAKRWALERIERGPDGHRLEPCLTYKVTTGPADVVTQKRRSMRVWIPRGCAPPNGITEGEWAAGAIDAFALPLGRYLRSRDELDGEPPRPQGGKKGSADGAVTADASR